MMPELKDMKENLLPLALAVKQTNTAARIER